jgi:hypothetical protein
VHSLLFSKLHSLIALITLNSTIDGGFVVSIVSSEALGVGIINLVCNDRKYKGMTYLLLLWDLSIHACLGIVRIPFHNLLDGISLASVR